jgi:adenylate kinase
VYAEQTAPLTAIYENREILKQVDGLGDVTEITNRILSALAVK